MNHPLFATALVALSALCSGCAYTATYRATAFAKNGALPPEHLAVVTLTAAEIRPGQRKAFFHDTRRVLAALPQQEGLLGHSFRFELFGDEAWTVSAWRDTAARDAFVRSPEHLAAMRRARETTTRVRFVTLHLPADQLPPRWRDVLALLKNAPARSRPDEEAESTPPIPTPAPPTTRAKLANRSPTATP